MTASDVSPVGSPTSQDENSGGASLYVVAFEEGRRFLADQLSELEGMRNRTVSFLAFVGSASGFLIGAALSNSVERHFAFYSLAFIATALSVAFVICAIWILLSLNSRGHSSRWRLNLSPRTLVGWIETDPPPAPSDFFRALAVEAEEMIATNDPALRRVRAQYVAVMILGIAQLIVWTWLAWMMA